MSIKYNSAIIFCVVAAGLCLSSCMSRSVVDRSRLMENDIPEHKLDENAFRDWSAIKEKWLRDVFPGCIEKQGIVLSCSGCERVYIRGILVIGADGYLVTFIKKDESVCGRRAVISLERCFVEYFFNIKFPESLRNTRIVVTLGNGLRC